MATRDERQVGLVATVGRYPVKSMRGEAGEVVLLTERGVIGDRTWAVLDLATGKVASAKRPRSGQLAPRRRSRMVGASRWSCQTDRAGALAILHWIARCQLWLGGKFS